MQFIKLRQSFIILYLLLFYVFYFIIIRFCNLINIKYFFGEKNEKERGRECKKEKKEIILVECLRI